MQTGSLDRRHFLIAPFGFAAAIAGESCAQPGVPDDWKPIESLLKLCKSMFETADLLGAGVDRNRFVSLLLKMDRPLRQIEAAKEQVQTAVTLVNCQAPPQTGLGIAEASARKIIPLVNALAERVEKLEDAVKPASVRTQVASVARDLRKMESRKMWVHRVNRYCWSSAAERNAFVAEVDGSIALVVKARAQLDALIEKLD